MIFMILYITDKTLNSHMFYQN